MAVHQRILVGTTATLQVTLVDGSGEPTAAAGAVSVVVTRSDGTTALPSATATAASSGWDAPNPYSVTLPAAANTNLDELTAVWTDAGDGSVHTTKIGVVGGIYAPIGMIRRSDTTLLDSVKYPDDAVRAARFEVESEFETVCARAFVPRFTIARLNGSGDSTLHLPMPHLRRIRAVTEIGPGWPTGFGSHSYRSSAAAGVTYSWTPAEVGSVAPSAIGIARRTDGRIWPAGHANLLVAWEHGMDVIPDDVQRAALTRIRSRLNMAKSGIPDRAVSFTQSEGGTFSIATPGMRGSITGIPEVDVVLNRWMWRRYQVTSVQC